MRGGERREQGEHGAGEGERLERAGAAAAGLAARRAEAPDVHGREQRERDEHERVREPLDPRVVHRRRIVAVRCPRVTRARSGWGRCLPLHCAGAAADRRDGASRSASRCRRLLRTARAGAGARYAGCRYWAPVAYAGPARELVRALKFRGALGVADAMAAQIVAEGAPAGWPRGRPVRSSRCRCTRAGSGGAASTRRACSRDRRSRAAPGCPSSIAWSGPGRQAPRWAAAGPSARLGPRGSDRGARHRRRRERCSSTTWPPRARPSPPARRRCEPPATSEVTALAFARTPGR